ncbi:metal ABC transporter substrate-binding protein [Pantoea ananatis]|nr:metal ABC transporter substrate-binding protein [Pantoea ananatis]
MVSKLSVSTLGMMLSVFISLNSYAADKFKVVTTFTVIADMAKNVAGEAAEVTSITKPGAEIHEYQPTPGDIKRAQGAQLVMANGLNLELWFQRFYQHLKGVPEVVVSTGVSPIGIGKDLIMANPILTHGCHRITHLIYVDNICDALVKHDPANASTYQQNAAAYKQKIVAALEPVHKQLAAIPENKRWIVTSEGAFSYLARDLGLKELYLWPINADQQGTPQQVRNVIDQMKKNAIPVIFSESTVSDKPARQVARETHAHYGGVLYVDSLSAANGPVPTYLDLLKVTTQTLVNGIQDGMKTP